ncbi:MULTISPECIES: ester cyclase [Actinomycetes]|uniref:ester cyclase n=1 Tax=Actinomycetes TaxID=1760 RepID=UPI002F941C3B|nr:ester cyclase [Nocardioides sp. NBC_00850]
MTHTELHKFYERYIAALNAHEFHRLDEFVADELTHFGDAVTRDQVLAALTAQVDAAPDLKWRLDDLRVSGHDLAARLTNTGTPVKEWLGVAPTGASFEVTEYALYRVRDGRFINMTNLQDSDTAREQLGG